MNVGFCIWHRCRRARFLTGVLTATFLATLLVRAEASFSQFQPLKGASIETLYLTESDRRDPISVRELTCLASPFLNSKPKEVRFLVVERERSKKAFIVSPGSFLIVGNGTVRSYLPSWNKLLCWGPIGELSKGERLETELKELLKNFDREKSLWQALADSRSSPDYRYFVPRYFFAPDEEPGGSGVEPKVVSTKIVNGELELTLENPVTRRMATLYVDVSKNQVTRSIVDGKPYPKREE